MAIVDCILWGEFPLRTFDLVILLTSVLDRLVEGNGNWPKEALNYLSIMELQIISPDR